jgi:hypothetical protein
VNLSKVIGQNIESLFSLKQVCQMRRQLCLGVNACRVDR